MRERALALALPYLISECILAFYAHLSKPQNGRLPLALYAVQRRRTWFRMAGFLRTEGFEFEWQVWNLLNVFHTKMRKSSPKNRGKASISSRRLINRFMKLWPVKIIYLCTRTHITCGRPAATNSSSACGSCSEWSISPSPSIASTLKGWGKCRLNLKRSMQRPHRLYYDVENRGARE